MTATFRKTSLAVHPFFSEILEDELPNTARAVNDMLDFYGANVHLCTISLGIPDGAESEAMPWAIMGLDDAGTPCVLLKVLDMQESAAATFTFAFASGMYAGDAASESKYMIPHASNDNESVH